MRYPKFARYQLTQFRPAKDEHLVHIEQLGLRAGRAWLEDRQPANFDPLAGDQLRRAHAHSQVRIVVGQHLFDATTDLFIHSVIEIRSTDNCHHGCQEQSPFECEPTEMDQAANDRTVPLLEARFRRAPTSLATRTRWFETQSQKSARFSPLYKMWGIVGSPSYVGQGGLDQPRVGAGTARIGRICGGHRHHPHRPRNRGKIEPANYLPCRNLPVYWAFLCADLLASRRMDAVHSGVGERKSRRRQFQPAAPPTRTPRVLSQPGEAFPWIVVVTCSCAVALP